MDLSETASPIGPLKLNGRGFCGVWVYKYIPYLGAEAACSANQLASYDLLTLLTSYLFSEMSVVGDSLSGAPPLSVPGPAPDYGPHPRLHLAPPLTAPGPAPQWLCPPRPCRLVAMGGMALQLLLRGL